MSEDAPSADSFGIGDTVAATSDFCIGGELAVQKGCKGTVICHGERPDGSIGVSIQFEKWKDGREANVLCRPNQIQFVSKAPCTDSCDTVKKMFSVVATSDVRIGGALAVQKGCKGTVIGHGERPDGSMGVSIQFDWRTDGGGAVVLCHPHEIQIVEAAHAQTMPENATSLVNHLRHAWGSIQAAALSLCDILPSSRMQFMFENWSKRPVSSGTWARTSDKTAVVKSDSTLHRRKPGGRRQCVRADDGDDDFDFDDTPSETSHQPYWFKLIAILIFVNLIFGYMHMQRRLQRPKINVVKILTDASFSDHIDSHPEGTLVSFYFPSCKPCAKLAPEFEEAARRLWKTRSVSLVAVNADSAPLTLQRYSVNMFPTLLWFRRGRLMRNPEPSVRDSAGIIEFVEESVQPSVIDFASHGELDDALPQLRSIMSRGKSPPVVVGFGDNPAVYEILEEMGEKFRGLTAFLFVKEAQDSDPFIRAYFRDAEADKEYSGGLNIDDVQVWLQPFMNDETVARGVHGPMPNER